MKVAIIGCGLIGHKRAKALGDCRLVVCVDKVLERAEKLAQQFLACEASDNWQQAITRTDFDIFFVSSLHNALAEITLGAVSAGKHVLVEKPAARRAIE